MNRFKKELTTFMNNYLQPHEDNKKTMDGWFSLTEKNLDKLHKQSVSFEKAIESRFEKLDRFLAVKQNEINRKME